MQTIYTMRDEVYCRVDALCTRAGVLGPSSFSPVPASVLMTALERIDVETLGEEDLREYEALFRMIEDDGHVYADDIFFIDPVAGANIGFNIADYKDFDHSNSSYGSLRYDHRENTLLPYRFEPALLSLGVKMGFGESTFLEGNIEMKNSNHVMYESTMGLLFTFLDVDRGMTREWPFRAGGSFGNSYFNLILGRFPHSIGNGITGNLLVGDNFNYQELFNVSLMSNHFSYNISITRFDMQRFLDEDNPDQSRTTISRSEFDGDQQFRVVHRFDVNMFDKVRLALNLGTIYSSQYGFDIRFLYPFVFGHNYYNYTNTLPKTDIDEANNIMSLEAEWVIIDGLRLTSQAVIDQLQMSWENKDDVPAAYGFLANLEYDTQIGKGWLGTWIEAVYTSPYLYLNGKYVETDTYSYVDNNLDYIVGYKMLNLDDFGFSGYIHGPDTIVLAIGADYADAGGRFEAGANLMYKVQGMKGLKYYSMDSQTTIIDMSDAYIGQDLTKFKQDNATPSGGWDSAEHLLKLAAFGIYNLGPYSWGRISFYAAAGSNLYFNFNHEKGNMELQPQMLIGVKYSF